MSGSRIVASAAAICLVIVACARPERPKSEVVAFQGEGHTSCGVSSTSPMHLSRVRGLSPEGHSFPYRGVAIWRDDVMSFLDRNCGR